MANSKNLEKNNLNKDIAFASKHEKAELKAIEKIAEMQALDPELNTLISYDQKIFSNVCIVPLFDLHIGGEGTNLKRLKLIIDFIKNTSNAVCLFGGDILDNATLNGATNAHTSKVNPSRALDLAVKLFEPIKDKTLCVLAGNHDGSSGSRNKDSNMAPAKEFAKRLGVKYCPYNAIISVNLSLKNSSNKDNKIVYNIFATHGSGRATNQAVAVDLALKKAENACARTNISPDLILTGHFHADANGIHTIRVPKYNSKGITIGEIRKSVRVESLSSMQETNDYSASNNMKGYVSNMYAINICLLKNPYYYEKTENTEWEYFGQSTKFPILRTNKNELSIIASQYTNKYSEQLTLESELREQYKNKSINEITEQIEMN